GIKAQKMVDPRVEVFQNARVAMGLLTADLRSACTLSKDYQFLGMQRMIGEVEADNLDFGTHHYTPQNPGEGDFCQTSYFVNVDRETGEFCLYRRRNPIMALDSLSGGKQQE